MPSFDFTLLTIVGCGIATWLSRAVPFALLKKFDLPAPLLEYLGFVPIVIMSALWFNNLFIRDLGHFPQLDMENLFASIPTLLVAILSKSLLAVVMIGIVSLAIIRLYV